MWSLTTSHGLRLDGIRSEQEARYGVRMLGVAEAIGFNSWQVVDNQGRRFVAELRRARPMTAARDPHITQPQLPQ
jgi:hypothetical protein